MFESVDLETYLRRTLERADADPPDLPADSKTRVCLLHMAGEAASSYRSWHVWIAGAAMWSKNVAPPAPTSSLRIDGLGDLLPYLSEQERTLLMFWLVAVAVHPNIQHVSQARLPVRHRGAEPFLVGTISDKSPASGTCRMRWFKAKQAPAGALRIADGLEAMLKVFLALHKRLLPKRVC